MSNSALRRLALLSIGAAVLTVGLKTVAWQLTGSVGLLSDAAESLVNFAAATVAWIALWYAARPVDRDHPYGHEKIEYFSSGLEGGLILVAGLAAMVAASNRFFHLRELARLDWGLGLSVIASVINLAVARILISRGKSEGSVVLEADGQHLLSDVVTSIGVLLGLGLQWSTGILWLDPALALVVGSLILVTGFRILYRSFQGLMDQSLPDNEVQQIRDAIHSGLSTTQMVPSEGQTKPQFHALRTRRAGSRRFVDFHLLVPGNMRVEDAHDLGEGLVRKILAAIGPAEVSFHLEPVEQPDCWNDSELIQIEKKNPLPAA